MFPFLLAILCFLFSLALHQGPALHASPDAKAEKTGKVWISPVNETLTYDFAGNRQGNALWDYGWDAKNQLVRARTKNYNTVPQGWDVSFAYDNEGRRIRKHIAEYKNGTKVSEKIITFVWDGWDLIYERHQAPNEQTLLERKYLWGPDIAGGSAGGAGGLLLIQETKGQTTTTLIPLYDGTGHLIGLSDLDKTLKATYIYGPFGEEIHTVGPMAKGNPWRFATKYLDEETGLYYFGKRYYDPSTCQWLSREPLGESESLNLYSYCHNDPVNNVDAFGLAPKWMSGDQAKIYDEMVAEWIGRKSGMSMTEIHTEVIRSMTTDGTLTEKTDAGSRGNWEREVLKNYLAAMTNMASQSGATTASALVGGASDVTSGLISSLPGGGPAGNGASDGSNTTPMLALDTFRANAAGLISLANFHSPAIQGAMGDFAAGYDAKYSYAQRTAAQTTFFLAPLLPKSIAGASKVIRSTPSLESVLYPSFAGKPGLAPGHVINPFGKTAAKSVATPYGAALQSESAAALAARAKVSGGSTLYRTGTTGRSAAGEAQFWALEHPSSSGFPARYGIPAENVAAADFIETATLKPGTPFITRPAPGIGTNPGGGIEVVVPSGGIRLDSFHYSPNILGQ